MFEVDFLIDNYESQIKQLVLKYINMDLKKLVFKKNITDIDKYAIRQARLRLKIKDKLPEFAENFDLILPDDIHLEQCSSELTAKHKAELVGKGNKFCDLTSGFGVDSIYLSSNYKENTFVSYNEDLYKILLYNLNVLKINAEVINQKAEDVLDSIDEYDLIYLDPDRRNQGRRLFLLEEIEPNIVNILDELLEKSKRVMIKLSPFLEIEEIKRNLINIEQIRVVSVKNECKEILVVLSKDIAETKTYCDIYRNSDFLQYEVEQSQPVYTDTIGKYIYEPDSSFMKLKSFGYICKKFELKKIDLNTHLFTSDEFISNFPGKVIEFVEEIKLGRKLLESKGIKQANIIARNYVDTPDELEKKLKIKQGSDNYLVCFKMDNKYKSILGKRKN
jgi:16S rRNA G966 N2-methylase RsmD